MDKRRTLLKASAAALVMAHPLAKAQGMHQAMPHHGMQATGHMNHGNMMSANTHGMSGANTLMPLQNMPSGLPHRPLAQLKNTAKKAQLFKATLVAEPATLTVAGRKPTEFWLYNGQLPGPQIEVYEGDTVEITFKNNLPETTTVHWHGLPVPADQDGNPQDAVPAGAQRTYRFTLPEGSAGTYWYHPHPHGRTAMQVAMGLAGTFIVRAKNDPLAHLALDEQHWMISDLRLDNQAAIPDNTMLDWMNGREGQFVLINGQLQPKISLSTHTRLRIWNSCAARYLRLAIPNAKWLLIGTDGGLLEQAQGPLDELFIAPAERVEAILIADQSSQSPLISHYYNREKMMVEEPAIDLTLAQLHITAKDPLTLPDTMRALPDLGTPTAHKKVEFSEMEMDHDQMPMDHGKEPIMHMQQPIPPGKKNTHHDTMSHGQMAMGHDMMASMADMFLINGRAFDMQRMDLKSKVGEVEEWRVFNNSHMDHPFHIHGTQFQVTQRELAGKITAEPFKAWRDTVNLRPYETVVFHVKQSLPGVRMFHCHILEHEDLGMMANLEVS